LANKNHLPPKTDAEAVDSERRLKKVGTRGVIQLFNAINKQKKTTDPTTSNQNKLEQLSKTKFLELLKNSKK